MKKIIALSMLLLLASCSKDSPNCDAEKASITKDYEAKMDYVRNNPGPTGVDYRQITLLQAEMAKKIAAACD